MVEIESSIINRYSQARSELAQKHVESNADLLSNVDEYFREIQKVPLLSAQEEVELSRKIQKGLKATKDLELGEVEDERKLQLLEIIRQSEPARERLTTANLRLVVSRSRRRIGYGQDFADLIQEGNAGLMKAVDKFDPEQGFRFSTYATYWIDQYINRAFANSSRTIRWPTHIHDMMIKVRQRSSMLAAGLGRDAEVWEIAEELELPIEKVEELMELDDLVTRSLDRQIIDEDKDTWVSVIADEKAADPEFETERIGFSELMGGLIQRLPSQEQSVIRMRASGMTLQETADRMKFTSRERTRQIETLARHRLRLFPELWDWQGLELPQLCLAPYYVKEEVVVSGNLDQMKLHAVEQLVDILPREYGRLLVWRVIDEESFKKIGAKLKGPTKDTIAETVRRYYFEMSLFLWQRYGRTFFDIFRESSYSRSLSLDYLQDRFEMVESQDGSFDEFQGILSNVVDQPLRRRSSWVRQRSLDHPSLLAEKRLALHP